MVTPDREVLGSAVASDGLYRIDPESFKCTWYVVMTRPITLSSRNASDSGAVYCKGRDSVHGYAVY